MSPDDVDEFLEWAGICLDGVLIDGEFYEYGDDGIEELWLARQTRSGIA